MPTLRTPLFEAALGFLNPGFRHAVAARPLLGGGFTVELDGFANRRTGHAAQQGNPVIWRVFRTIGWRAESKR